jgi:nucleoid-associated protein YgaU
VFSSSPTPRRGAAWPAAAALLALAVAAVVSPVASPVARAQGPAGGYHAPGSGNGLEAVWSAVRAPLRWLRQSSRSFQGLMRLLAERSAHVAGSDGRPPPPRSKRAPEEAEEEPPRQSVNGGEAGAGRDEGARVKEWHKRADAWSKVWPEAEPTTGHRMGPGQTVSCQRAGIPVPQGSWYVVQQGDTLWRIAEVHLGYGEAYLRLRRANGARLPDANRIYPCQRLYIPRRRCCGSSSALDSP